MHLPRLALLALIATAAAALDTVTITRIANASENGPQVGAVLFKRTGTGIGDVQIKYALAGDAVQDVDYTLIDHSGIVTIPSGSLQVPLLITPKDNGVGGARRALVSIVADGAYTTGTQNAATVTIADKNVTLSVSTTIQVADPLPPSPSGILPIEVDGRAEWLVRPSDHAAPLSRTVSILIGGDAVDGPLAVNGTDYILAYNSKPLADTATDITAIQSVTKATPDPAPGPGATRIGVTDTSILGVNDIFVVELPSRSDETIHWVTQVDAGDTNNNPSITFTPALTAAQSSYATTQLRRLGKRVNPGVTQLNLTGFGDIWFAAYPVLGSTTPRGHRSMNLTAVSSADFLVLSPGSSTARVADRVAVASMQWVGDAGQPLTNGSAKVILNSALPIAIDAYYLVSPTGAVYGDDFLIPGVDDIGGFFAGLVHIPAGQTSATITVTPVGTALDDPAEIALDLLPSDDFILATSGTSPYASSTVVNLAPALKTDADEPVYLSITKKADAIETTPGGKAKFTVTLTNAAGVALTGTLATDLAFTYTTGGAAVANVNYSQLSGTAKIPAGESSVDIEAQVIDDHVVRDDRDLVLTLQTGAAYQLAGSYTTATALIRDGSPSFSVTDATDPTAGGAAGVFTITAATVPSSDITLHLTVGGTATSGTDYTSIAATKVFPANAASTTVDVIALAGATAGKTVTLAVATDTANPATYKVAASTAQTATILAGATLPYVAIAKVQDGNEGDADTATTDVKVRLYLTDSSGTALTSSTLGDLAVQFTLGGTAVAGTNYATLSHTATILGTTLEKVITISVINDGLYTANLTLPVTISASSSYNIAAGKGTATPIIIDSSPVITVTAGADPQPGHTGVFTLHNAHPTIGVLTVKLATSGTATSGTDYIALPATVDFAASADTATVDAVVAAGATTGDTIVLTVSTDTAPAKYKPGSTPSATLTIGGSGGGTDGGTNWNNGGGGCGAGAAGLLALAGVLGLRRRGRR